MNLKIDEKLRAISKSRSKDNLDKIYYPDVDVSDYFFVSYSHKDYRAVYKDIIKLRQCGLKFWYDRDMPSNSDWKEVANRYMRPLLCKGVIFYISENSLRDYETTKATIDEIKYAKEIGKQIITINLASKLSKDGHNKNVVLSASKMVEKLIEEGRLDLIKHKKVIEKIFPEKVIYLPINLNPKIRKERIEASLKEQSKLIFDDETIVGVSDTSIINVTEDEFNKTLLDNEVDLIDRTFHLKLGNCAFANCQSLETVNFSSPLVTIQIDTIGDYAFSNCTSLTKIESSAYLGTCVGNGVFYNCEKLESYPTTLRLSGEKTFYNCKNLKRIDVAKNSSYGDYVFYNCSSLEEVTCDGLQIYNGDDAYEINNKIGKQAFYGCSSLKNVAIFHSIEEIGPEAFAYCDSFIELSIPEFIKKIDYGAHSNNKSLRKVAVLSPNIEMDFRSVFSMCRNLEEIVISKENKDFRVIDGAVYKENTLEFYPYGNKKEILTFDENCTDINQFAICFNPFVKEIHINKNFSDTHFQFAGLENLERITVDENNEVFKEVDGILYSKDLKHLFYVPKKAIKNNEYIMPDSVESFSIHAFSDVYNLERIKFSDKIRKIDLQNNSFKEVILPASLETTPNISSALLEKIYIEGNDKFFTSKDHKYLYLEKEDGIELCVVSPFVKEVILEEGITTISDKAFLRSKAETICFPDTLRKLPFDGDVRFENLKNVSISKNTKFNLFNLLYYYKDFKLLNYRGTADEFIEKYEKDSEKVLATGNFEFYDYARNHKTFIIECDDRNLRFKGPSKKDFPVRLLFKNPNKKDDD